MRVIRHISRRICGRLTFAAVAGTLSTAAIGASATSSSTARHVGYCLIEVGKRVRKVAVSVRRRLRREGVVDGQMRGFLYLEAQSPLTEHEQTA